MKNFNIEEIAKAIEVDADQKIPGLRESLEQAKNGVYAEIHTPEKIIARRGRPVGSVKQDNKQAVKLRFDTDVLDALRASGRGWQTRVNDAMRDLLKLGH